MTIQEEIREKEERVREFLERQGLGAVLLTRQDNFSWITAGGDNKVVTASEVGVAALLLTGDKKYVITNNIEAPRIMEEELKDKGFKLKSSYWYDEKGEDIIKRLTKGMKIGADTVFKGAKDISSQFAKLRYSLLEEEIERYRSLGEEASKCVGKVARRLKVGETEHQIAARLAKGLVSQGITPTVLLIAADERIFKFRHPLPTDKRLDKYVMLVICGRKWGLVVSLTRLVCFGRLSREIKKKHKAVTFVDATFIAHTKPGKIVGDIFKKGMGAYKTSGYPDEWRLHHQGGPTGYAGRDYKALAKIKEKVLVNQAFAWNPSISGTKSEDTIIALKDKTEIITETPNWPMVDVEVEGIRLRRADILIR